MLCNTLTIKIAHVTPKTLHKPTFGYKCDHNTRHPTGSHRTRRRHPCMLTTDARTTTTNDSATHSNHFTHTYTHPLCQNSHPRLPTAIPSYEYHTHPSVMGQTDEAPHHKHNNHMTGACPAPSKPTPPLLHHDINLPKNSSPPAAQSLYPGRKLTTIVTGETWRTGNNQDHSLTSNLTETAESPPRYCQGASRRGNAGLGDRRNFREI